MAGPSDEVRALLSARNMAHAATLMADGSPHVSPVWIAVEGDRLAIFFHPGASEGPPPGRSIPDATTGGHDRRGEYLIAAAGTLTVSSR